MDALIAEAGHLFEALAHARGVARKGAAQERLGRLVSRALDRLDRRERLLHGRASTDPRGWHVGEPGWEPRRRYRP